MGKGKTVKTETALVPIQDEVIKSPVEIPEAINKENLVERLYVSASLLKLTPEEETKLQEKVDIEDVEVRPDGLIYYPQVFVRDVLNKTFGRGQWALIEHKTIEDKEHNKLYFQGSLYIRGCFVAKAVGESNYFPLKQGGQPNPMFSWASVYESAKSDCLVRCGKDLGVGKELWQPKYSRSFLSERCIKVYRKDKGEYQWRLKASDPFYDEDKSAKTKDPKPETKSEPKPENKKVTKVNFSNAKNMVELKKMFNSIPPELRTDHTKAAKERKDELKVLLNTEIKELSIFEIIDQIKCIETKDEIGEYIRKNAHFLDTYHNNNIEIKKAFELVKGFIKPKEKANDNS